MQGWRKINFIDEFATAFRVPVFIEQDARAGALAHYLFDPSVHADGNLAYYLVGEGVGLGVIDNGRLINGFLGAATEIGHISIDVNGRPCDCGNVGCLERYCSTPAIHDTLIADGTVVPGAADMTHTEAARACSPKPATATKRQSPLSAKSPDTSATDASPSSMDTILSTSSSATSCPKPARYCSMRCAPRWPNGPSPKSMPPLPSAYPPCPPTRRSPVPQQWQ